MHLRCLDLSAVSLLGRLFRTLLGNLEILFALHRLDGLLAPFEQGHQRVRRVERIDVENQATAVLPGRFEREHLRIDLGLQLHDQAHDARLEAAGTQQLDIGIVGGDLAGQAVEHAVEFDAFDVDDQAIRVLDGEMAEFERCVVFEGNAGVVGGRPDADGEDGGQPGGCAGQRCDGEDQRGAGIAEQLAAPMAGLSAFRHACPFGESARASRRRPTPA